MKEYFYEKDNQTYIIDDNEGLITRDAKDNTEETLIVENDIEQLEKLIENLKNHRFITTFLIHDEGIKLKILSALIVLADILVFCVIYKFLTLPSILAFILLGLVMGAFTLPTVFNCKKEKNDIKSTDVLINEYETELENQKNKLYELNSVAKDKIVDSTIIKKVPNSELINSLKKKRELVTHYFNNKKTYITAYKNNELENSLKTDGYNDNDIELLKFLIEEEINKKEKGHQKKYTN